LEQLLLPLRCKRSNQWGPWIVNSVFHFTKQLKSAVYLKRSRVNKQTPTRLVSSNERCCKWSLKGIA
jgi:hypothetical protein